MPRPTMNTAAQTFALAFGSVLAAAGIGVALANHMADDGAPATRSSLASQAGPAAASQVARLPRVVIEKRQSAEGMRLAQAPGRQAM